MKSRQFASMWLCAIFPSTIALKGAAHGYGVRKCPDDSHCILGTSCMNLSRGNGGYGCCPYDRGVSCFHKSDAGSSIEEHGCCRRGHRCHEGACSYEEGGVSWTYAPAALLPPLRGNLRSSSCSPKETVECQDHTMCPAGGSCCRTPQFPVSSYACCPYGDDRVCCADGTCCDAGYRCEPRWGICTPTVALRTLNRTGAPAVRLIPVPARRGPRSKLPVRSTSDRPWIQCADGTFCHRNSTCCSAHTSSPAHSSSGLQYACCPHEEAECCADGEHCCPHGTQCERFDQRFGHRCLLLNGEGGRAVPAFKQYPSFKGVPGDTYPSVPCPTWMVCGSGSCCRNEFGAYRCCPYPGGVCCASGISGCPPNMECVN